MFDAPSKIEGRYTNYFDNIYKLLFLINKYQLYLYQNSTYQVNKPHIPEFLIVPKLRYLVNTKFSQV